MKTKKILFSALLLTAVVVGAMAANDPTLMKINGKKVPLSEFEYMYHKNSDQQMQPLSLNEYVDMFVNYKLKVLAAEEAGIDTTASFRKEFDDLGIPVFFVFKNDDEYEKFLLKDFKGLPKNTHPCIDEELLNEITEKLHLKEKTLPIFILVNEKDEIVFSRQGYSIGLGEQLLKSELINL